MADYDSEFDGDDHDQIPFAGPTLEIRAGNSLLFERADPDVAALYTHVESKYRAYQAKIKERLEEEAKKEQVDEPKRREAVLRIYRDSEARGESLTTLLRRVLDVVLKK